jgi:acyl dehydratase
MTWKNLCWEDISEGLQIPTSARQVTTTDIVACAVASRDFLPLHHDRDYAQKAGLRDVVLNTPTLYGLTGKYLTDWAGPEAELKEISLQITASCYPGDTLTTSGVVRRKQESDGMHLAYVDITFSVPSGVNARGKAILALPSTGKKGV